MAGRELWNGEPAFRVSRPVMTQRWMKLSALHWRVDPRTIQAKLPEGLTADEFEGSGWVGLIPFAMVDIAPGTGPAVPYLGTFPETNVRTYVSGPAGHGIWFHSLDISRLIPVVAARITYRLPYIWGKMTIDASGDSIEYLARRRWPGAEGETSHVRLEIGDRISNPTQLDHFLSSRWGLYTTLGRRLAFAKVEHEPWPLRSARLTHLHDDLVEAAGYSIDGRPDHVAYSPEVSVRIERPRFV